MLGGLEHQIMEVLWSSSEPLKPSDVLKRMKGEHAYTTIMTVLKRMTDKKLLRRKLKGNVYFYSPCQDKTTFASSCLEDLFKRLFNSYGEHVAPAFEKISKEMKVSAVLVVFSTPLMLSKLTYTLLLS
ncbi:MAG TPA: BlaI/MecI/CopY family transcriptional regulator [Patescibacteria group bacterium]